MLKRTSLITGEGLESNQKWNILPMIIFWSAIRSHLIERVCCCTREIIKKTKTNKDMPFVGCCISITGVGCHRQRVGISFAYSCRNCCVNVQLNPSSCVTSNKREPISFKSSTASKNKSYHIEVEIDSKIVSLSTDLEKLEKVLELNVMPKTELSILTKQQHTLKLNQKN